MSVEINSTCGHLRALLPIIAEGTVDAIESMTPPPLGNIPIWEAQEILGDGVNVVAAFQNVGFKHLLEDHPVPCDVLVCGDDDAAREQALHLVAAAKLVGWDAGPLQNAPVVEGLTSILIGINQRYKIKGAGIRITGEPVDRKDTD